jgi:nitrogen fixation NifU-like protein
MDDLYRDYILEHYRRPHNFGVIESPDLRWEGANPLCGDRITMTLTIRDGRVADVAFTGRGCAISQASASLLTDEIRGKSLEDIERLTPDFVLDLLGIEISPARLKCALLSLDTLSHAVSEGAIGRADGPDTVEGPIGWADGIGAGEGPATTSDDGRSATGATAPGRSTGDA